MTEFFLKYGKMVVLAPESAPGGVRIGTDRFQFQSPGGEIGVTVDDNESDIIMFSGGGSLNWCGCWRPERRLRIR